MIIVPSDDLLRRRESTRFHKRPIASPVDGTAVLPEYPDRDGVENGFQHPARFPKFVLGLFAVGYIAGGGVNEFIPGESFPLQPPVGSILAADPVGDRHCVGSTVEVRDAFPGERL